MQKCLLNLQKEAREVQKDGTNQSAHLLRSLRPVPFQPVDFEVYAICLQILQRGRSNNAHTHRRWLKVAGLLGRFDYIELRFGNVSHFAGYGRSYDITPDDGTQ